MAVIASNRIATGPKGSTTVKGIREYTSVFRVQVDSQVDGPLTILADLIHGVPLMYDRYRDANNNVDPFTYCEKVQVVGQEPENPFFWLLTADYTNDWSKLAGGRKGSPPNNPDPSNPLARPPIIDFDDSQYQRVSQASAGGQSYVNSANDYFEPAPEEDDCRGIVRITQNEASYDSGAMAQFRNTCNATPFFGNGFGCCKMNSIRGKEVFENNSSPAFFYTVTYEIHVRAPYPGGANGLQVANANNLAIDLGLGAVPNPIPGWVLILVDKGFRELGANGNKIILMNGSPAVSPVRLDGAGHQAGAGVVKFMGYMQYRLVDWTTKPGRPLPISPPF